MTRFLRVFVLAAVLAAMGSIFHASHALAASAAPSASSAMGYCGSPVTSKAAMINWYQSHPVARAHAEQWVRAHAGYYHLRADQSFTNWLQQPNVKFFKAPRGYKLTANTSCTSSGVVKPFHGKYAVGGLGMLWWCDDPSGSGKGCAPITKGYCRNFVMGPKIPAPKPPPTPSTPPSTGNCNANNSPGAIVCSTVTIIISCGVLQVVGTGNTVQEAIANAKANASVACGSTPQSPPACTSNCNPQPPSCNPCQPPPPKTCQETNTCPPPPTCPPGTTGTPPNCVTPPPVNHPPTVSIPGPAHVFVNGTVSYCVTASDPDGDSLTYTFTTSNGTVVGDGNCYHYRAPSTPGSANVTVYVNDGKGGRASATTTEFPIVADDFGG